MHYSKMTTFKERKKWQRFSQKSQMAGLDQEGSWPHSSYPVRQLPKLARF
jgi:hypothetical protein